MSDVRTDSARTLGHLTAEEGNRLMELADRFEQACQSGPADLAGFLPPPEDTIRGTALHELIKTDLEIRWRHGQKPTLDDYLASFPELGPREALPPSLIYEEYRVRQRYGDQPAVASYEARFPAQFPELQRLVREHPSPTLTGPRPGPAPAAAPRPAAPAPPEAMASTAGDYRLIKRIGSGGFGEVWRAEAPGGIEVAVKIIFRPLDHEEAQRELQSLELIKNLRHHYLLQTHRFWSEQDRLRIVMELADGSLRDRLKDCRAQGLTGVPARELVRYIHEAAEALDFLHARKPPVLHRDIKPENILLVGQHVKVADFGLARLQLSQRSTTASGSGTPAYMAPEIWSGKVSVHSDQYSLAVTYAELRLDRRPFGGTDMMALMFSHLQGKPDLSPLPAAEQEVLQRALAKDPNERFASCLQFVEALEAAVARDQGLPPPAGGRAPAPIPADTPPAGAPSVMATLPCGDLPAAEREVAMMETVARQHPGGDRPEAWRKPRRDDPVVTVTTRARSGPSWKAVVGVLLCVLAGAAAAGIYLWRKPGSGGEFSLGALAPLNLRAGDTRVFDLAITRQGFTGPVELTFQDLPHGVHLAPSQVVMASEVSQVPVTLSTDPDAAPQAYEISVRAVGSGLRPQTATFSLDLLPADFFRPDMPEQLKTVGRWEPARDTNPVQDSGRLLSHRLDFVFKDDGTRVTFVLIPPGEGDDLRPFYIMENKVTNRLFAKYAAANRVYNNSWKDGALGDKGMSLGVGGRDDYPVFRVGVEEASGFAHWLGGDLPTVAEWQKAAGFKRDKRTRGEGPFRGTWDEKSKTQKGIAVGRDGIGPLKAGEAVQDESWYHVRDMAGNGREWTRNVVDPHMTGSVYVPLPRKASYAQDRVHVLGRSYREDQPLRFRDLESPEGDSLGYTEVQEDVSFRVVIEPPAAR